MRINKSEVEKKEAWLVDLFSQQPELSIPKASEQLVKQFGHSMNRARMYTLRAQAVQKTPEAKVE